MKTDTLFYQLFQTCPGILFELLGQDPKRAESYEFSSREVKQLAFRLDGLFLPTQPGIPLYFVEVQFQPDPEFYYRFVAEVYLYLRQYQPQRTWQAVAIYPNRKTDLGIPVDLESCTEQIRQIYLSDLPSEGSLLMELLRLIIAPNKEAEEQAQRLARRGQGIPPEVLELMMITMMYKFAGKSREEIEAMFGLSDLKKTRAYQDIWQEGRQEGQQEGRQEGIQTGEANLTLRQLRRKLGSLSPELEARIRSLSVEQLEDLAERLLDFGSLGDLQAWLGSL